MTTIHAARDTARILLDKQVACAVDRFDDIFSGDAIIETQYGQQVQWLREGVTVAELQAAADGVAYWRGA